MRRITVGLWLALAGAILQLIALGSDFYVAEGERKDAWLGIPHASDLILASGVVAIAALSLSAANRSPLRGRSLGVLVGVVGLVAALHLGYRMIAPPFAENPGQSNFLQILGSCYFYCSPAEAGDAKLLPGIWIGLVGCVAVALGGFLHALTKTARETPANFWVSESQPGMTPWLGVASLAAVASFVIGFSFFTFYTSTARGGGQADWSGWLPSPHTSSMVLAIALAIVLLARAAARRRAPLDPAGLGMVVAVLGFAAAARLLFRIIEPPFTQSPAEVGLAGYLSLAAAAVVVVAGVMQALAYRQRLRGPDPQAAHQ